jgi:hypothetical protein
VAVVKLSNCQILTTAETQTARSAPPDPKRREGASPECLTVLALVVPDSPFWDWRVCCGRAPDRHFVSAVPFWQCPLFAWASRGPCVNMNARAPGDNTWATRGARGKICEGRRGSCGTRAKGVRLDPYPSWAQQTIESTPAPSHVHLVYAPSEARVQVRRIRSR